MLDPLTLRKKNCLFLVPIAQSLGLLYVIFTLLPRERTAAWRRSFEA